MRTRVPLMVALGVCCACGPAWADPLPGCYRSRADNGVVHDARATITHWTPGGAAAWLNVESWDGKALGRQWKVRCSVRAATLPTDSSAYDRATGSGMVVSEDIYLGGTFILFDDSTVGWGSGAGSVDTTRLVVREHHEAHRLVRSETAIFSSARFSRGGCRLELVAMDVSWQGDTAHAGKPGTYPEFLGDGCRAVADRTPNGDWFDVGQPTFEVVAAATDGTSPGGELAAFYRRLRTAWRLGRIETGAESAGSGQLGK